MLNLGSEFAREKWKTEWRTYRVLLKSEGRWETDTMAWDGYQQFYEWQTEDRAFLWLSGRQTGPDGLLRFQANTPINEFAHDAVLARKAAELQRTEIARAMQPTLPRPRRLP